MNKTAQFSGGVSEIENTQNKVDFVDENSTQKQYPSAKATFEALKGIKENILSGDTEFVFVGGDASSKARGVLAVDSELSSVSENPVQNKKVFEKFSKFNQLLEKLKIELLDLSHPVGCLYWSEKATDPSELFGGTWVRIKDSFVWAAGDIEEITYTKDGEIVTEKLTVGKTGGEATHTLTVEEMPEHKHDKILMGAGGNYQITYLNVGDLGSGQSAGVGVNGSQPIYTSTAGGSQPHNNMPPYIAMYCWKRTA